MEVEHAEVGSLAPFPSSGVMMSSPPDLGCAFPIGLVRLSTHEVARQRALSPARLIAERFATGSLTLSPLLEPRARRVVPQKCMDCTRDDPCTIYGQNL